MRTLFCTALILSAALFLSGGNAGASRQATRFMAFCTDGDGDLSGWVTSRNEAYLAGRTHEQENRGHRWEVLAEGSETRPAGGHCSVTAPGKREGTIRVVNVCTECRIFRVARKTSDGQSHQKEITFQPNSSRYFRTLPDTQFSILRETNCPGQ